MRFQKYEIAVKSAPLVALFRYFLTGAGITCVAFSSVVQGAGIDANDYSVQVADHYLLLNQASFGADAGDLIELNQAGAEAWLNRQTNRPAKAVPKQLNRTLELALVSEPSEKWLGANGFNPDAVFRIQNYQLSAWWQNALTSNFQLQQRVAFALSELWVVSTGEAPLHVRAEALANYQDILLSYAFGNYRDLMGAVSRNPAMGVYLSHQGNKTGNPDENYARELMQLFTLGVNELNENGEPVLKQGEPVAVYSQNDVMELARVLTGWDLKGNISFGNGAKFANYILPMGFTKSFHDSGSKVLLGKQIPAGLSGEDDLNRALDIIFGHPNLPPFVSKQLILKLVSSNPSPEYVGRVSAVFKDNGSGVRGDLGAVVKAILLDPEARASGADAPKKLKEPVIWFAGLLRFLNVGPADQFQWKNGPRVDGVYWFKPLGFGQDPYRSPSVFNFFEPDDQPSGTAFKANDWVAPEASLLTTEALVTLDQRLADVLRFMDKQSFALMNAKQKANARKKLKNYPLWVTVDSAPLMQLLEVSIDGDANGDFAGLARPKRTASAARKAHMQHSLQHWLDDLAVKMMGKPLQADQKAVIVKQLMTVWLDKAPATPPGLKKQAHEIMSQSVRLIAMTPQYWLQ